MSTARTPRWVKLLLIASLAINVTVVGIMAGAAMREPVARADRMSLPIEGFRRVHRAMPDAEQAALRADLIAQRSNLRAARQQARALHEDFLAALIAQPYSEAAVREVFAAHRSNRDGVADLATEALLKRIAAMSPEARVDFAEKLRMSRRRGGRQNR